MHWYSQLSHHFERNEQSRYTVAPLNVGISRWRGLKLDISKRLRNDTPQVFEKHGINVPASFAVALGEGLTQEIQAKEEERAKRTGGSPRRLAVVKKF